MTIHQLEESLFQSLTSIQFEEEVKKYIGQNIEITEQIEDIRDNRITLVRHYGHVNSDYISPECIIYFDKTMFSQSLLSVSMGSYMVIIGKLTSVTMNKKFQFELVSIEKYTLNEPKLVPQKQYAQKKVNSGCFIATACYGNYNSTEVLVLRKFRDETLLKTFFGKIFVSFYYLISPFFAKLISKSDLLKKYTRKFFLDPIVAALKKSNYEAHWKQEATVMLQD